MIIFKILLFPVWLVMAILRIPLWLIAGITSWIARLIGGVCVIGGIIGLVGGIADFTRLESGLMIVLGVVIMFLPAFLLGIIEGIRDLLHDFIFG